MIKHTLICRSTRLNKVGESPLYFIVSIRGARKWIATGIFVSPKWWDKDKEFLKSDYPKYNFLAPIISDQKFKADRYCQKLYFERAPFEVKDFVRAVIKGDLRELENPLFSDMTKRYIDVHALSGGTLSHYDVFLNHLEQFRPGTRILDVDYIFAKQFEKFLQVRKGNAANTVSNKLKLMKVIIHYAQAERILKEDPLIKIKIGTHKSRRTALTRAELLHLQDLYEKKEINQTYLPILQYFLFSCYTGLRYGDLKEVKAKDIVDGMISIYMHKTRKPVDIPLIDEAKKLINLQSDGKLFNVLSNQPTNRYLKQIGKDAGITKTLTFHVARHTFATVSLTLGIPIKVLSEILGHTTVKTTEIYLHIFNEVRREEMQKWNNLRNVSSRLPVFN